MSRNRFCTVYFVKLCIVQFGNLSQSLSWLSQMVSIQQPSVCWLSLNESWNRTKCEQTENCNENCWLKGLVMTGHRPVNEPNIAQLYVPENRYTWGQYRTLNSNNCPSVTAVGTLKSHLAGEKSVSDVEIAEGQNKSACAKTLNVENVKHIAVRISQTGNSGIRLWSNLTCHCWFSLCFAVF